MGVDVTAREAPLIFVDDDGEKHVIGTAYIEIVDGSVVYHSVNETEDTHNQSTGAYSQDPKDYPESDG